MEFYIEKPEKGLKNKKINLESLETIAPEEVFLDRLAQRREEDLGISEKKFEVPLSRKMLQIFFALCVVAIGILFSKTFSLQVLQGAKYQKMAADNSQRIIFEKPDRGVIYDKNGEQLVSNIPSFDLVLDRRDLPKDEIAKENILKTVAGLLKINFSEMNKTIEASAFPVISITENLNHEALLSLDPRIKDLIGFSIENSTIRDYKDGSFFSHLVGYLGKVTQKDLDTYENYSFTDYIGKDGLEKSYENILRGEPGITEILKDAKGYTQGEKKISSSKSGESLVLNLDAGLQRKLEQALKQTLANTGSKKGTAVALDPKTGGVLAMVSLPTFDNNLFSQGISQKSFNEINNNPLMPMFNRAVSGEYVVGSTIKPLLSVAGLEEKVITPQTKVNDSEGKICIQNQWDPKKSDCYASVKVCGIIDIYSATAYSCNVYFYALGGGWGDIKGLGLNRITKWLDIFGWGKETQIDLPGEAEGLLPSAEWKQNNFKDEINKIWYLGDTYHLSIGQGFLKVTPLQLAVSYQAIANEGTIYKPEIVKEIVDSSGGSKNVVEEIKPKILAQNFANKKSFDVVREAMRQTVEYGSAYGWLDNLPVKAAAKTGTAQTGTKGYNHSWVSVFAPFDDPRIVLVVLVENVKEGQVAALPVAKDVLEWYFTK